MKNCPFCLIMCGYEPAKFVAEWHNCDCIVPLNPVVDGHMLVIPRKHVADFTTDPVVSGVVMKRAGELAGPTGSYNVITSKGRSATQSVFHLHLHLVPREENDGLALPWYSGKSRKH